MGTIHTANPNTNNSPTIPLRYFPLRLHHLLIPIETLLSNARLQDTLRDPLYPSYISRALTSGLLPSSEVLKSLCATIQQNQTPQETTRYTLMRLINQAFTIWKPNSISAEDRTLLWTVETVLHKSVTDETLLLDQLLFIEIFEIWNYLLTSQGLRPLFMAEKEKNPGIPERRSLVCCVFVLD